MSKLFTVKDTVSETFIPPFMMKTERDAIDGFKMVTNDPKSNYNKFPKDFTLNLIGTFDERTAEIKSHEPKLICRADSLIEEEKNNE